MGRLMITQTAAYPSARNVWPLGDLETCEPQGFLHFLVALFVGFWQPDPRVITKEERRAGITAKKF
jgi:hypothetical protein